MASLFEAYITNLGKYNEGELVGETLKFPTTTEEVQGLLKRIGVDGVRYEEFFITSFDGDVLGLYDYLGEYENLDELNHLACLLSELDQGDLEKFEAVIDSGEHTSSVADLINLAQNLDCYEFYPGVEDDETLGRIYVEDMEAIDIPDHLLPYFDYEAYGRDVRINEDGHFAPGGYVLNNGGKFIEHYHGIEDIPAEHKVFAFPQLSVREQMAAYKEIIDGSSLEGYIDWSTRVYSVYLKHVAPEDIYPYSIDEVFIDATSYLQTYHLSAREFARKIILDILQTTGITAAAGIGTNLYLAKVAMDIGAKHVPADEYGVRIAELDEMGYRRSFWTHRPLTDFWRVGKGYAAKLEANGLYTMGDIARCSIGQPTDYHNEELLYKLFGVNAELLIDHAWGWEPCTIADIKAYKPENKSIVSGQILQYPYPFEKARLVIQEMADALALELVDKRLATNQLVLTVGYDIENLKGTVYTGEVTTDRYGRKIPKHAHGTVNLDGYTSSGEELLKAATSLYDRIVDKTLLARRLTLCANHLLDESSVPEDLPEQIDLFTDYSAKEKQKKEADTAHARERKLQETMLDIKKRFGKNAILKGLNLEDGATARERNNQIGGHKA